MQFFQNQLTNLQSQSEGPKGHLSVLPPHQVKVKKPAFRFSQSATFYDKKFYVKLKLSVPKMCTLCTVYTQNSQSTCKENSQSTCEENAKQHQNNSKHTTKIKIIP